MMIPGMIQVTENTQIATIDPIPSFKPEMMLSESYQPFFTRLGTNELIIGSINNKQIKFEILDRIEYVGLAKTVSPKINKDKVNFFIGIQRYPSKTTRNLDLVLFTSFECPNKELIVDKINFGFVGHIENIDICDQLVSVKYDAFDCMQIKSIHFHFISKVKNKAGIHEYHYHSFIVQHLHTDKRRLELENYVNLSKEKFNKELGNLPFFREKKMNYGGLTQYNFVMPNLEANQVIDNESSPFPLIQSQISNHLPNDKYDVTILFNDRNVSDLEINLTIETNCNVTSYYDNKGITIFFGNEQRYYIKEILYLLKS